MAETTTLNNEQKLRKVFETLFDDHNQINMQLLHRVWFRNILYYLGEQWFEWVRGQNTFRRLMPSPYLPTPVANIIRDFVRSIKALILNKDYTVSIWPNSNDQNDREAAEMGESFLKWLETYDDERHLDEKEKIAVFTLLCGVGFDRTYNTTEDDAWVFDKAGNPIRTGNVVSEAVNPFSIVVDSYGDTLRKKRFVGIKSLRPREWVEDTWKIKVPGGNANDSGMIDYERQLARMVASVSPWKGDGLEFSQSIVGDEDLVIFKEVEMRPTRDYPKGRYAAMVGDQIIFDYKRLPIQVSKDGRWDYSLTDFHYHFVPGRFWSDSGVNDLISPQNTINQIDQDLEINRKGIGKPMVLVPTDVTMKKLTRFGQSVLVLQYDALLAGGAKPEIGRGIPLPGQVLDERMIHLQNAQDASGDPKNVLRGKAPNAQASGVMVDILRDSAEQGHLPDVERFYRSYKRTKRKQLLLAQEVYTEERMIKIPDQGGRPKVLRFKGSELRDNTDVRIELSSGAASTRAGQTSMILKFVEQGFFSPENMMDPELKQEILRRVGLGGFRDKTNIDVKRAVFENEMVAGLDPKDIVTVGLVDNETGTNIEVACIPGLFAAMGDGQGGEGLVIQDDPLFRYDNHEVHFEMHRRFILSSEFRFLHPEIQAAFTVHADFHKWTLEAEQQRQQQAAMEAAMTQKAMEQALAGGQQPAGGNGGPPQPGQGGPIPEPPPAEPVPGPMSIGPTSTGGYQPGTYEG